MLHAVDGRHAQRPSRLVLHALHDTIRIGIKVEVVIVWKVGDLPRGPRRLGKRILVMLARRWGGGGGVG